MLRSVVRRRRPDKIYFPYGISALQPSHPDPAISQCSNRIETSEQCAKINILEPNQPFQVPRFPGKLYFYQTNLLISLKTKELQPIYPSQLPPVLPPQDPFCPRFVPRFHPFCTHKQGAFRP